MSEERNPVDQLVDLFIYAPIGLLYERDEVLSRLVTRGRSQVQLARVLGQLAVRRGQGQLEDRLTEVFGSSGAGIARFLTELGEIVGLAPPSTGTEVPAPAAGGAGPSSPPRDEAAGGTATTAGTAAEEPPDAAGTLEDDVEAPEVLAEPAADDAADRADLAPQQPTGAGTAGEEPPATPRRATAGQAARTPRPSLPIAGYDQLSAREIIPLLVDLSPAQRRVIRDHELSRRARKTILHQIQLLEP